MRRGHGRPPRRMAVAPRAGRAGSPRTRAAPRRRRSAGSSPGSRSQASGTAADDRLQHVGGRRSGARRVSAAAIEPANGSSTWSRICANGAGRARRGIAPRVLDVQRRTVVDQPEPAMPDEEVRVLRGPVDVRRPARRTRRRPPRGRAREAARPRGERRRPRQEVQPEVQARAAIQQLLHLEVGLGPTEHADRRRRTRSPGRAVPGGAPARRRSARLPAPWGPGRRRGTSTTYSPSSSASMRPGSDPPSRSCVT